MALADRYGLPVTTSSAIAVERYQDGMDNLLAYGLDGERSFAEAVAADEGLALAHAGGALLAVYYAHHHAAHCEQLDQFLLGQVYP